MKRIIIIIVCICLTLSQAGCGRDSTRSLVQFYYYRTDAAYGVDDGVLVPEVRELTAAQDDLTPALELYLRGPETAGLECPIPAGTRVLSWSRSGDALQLHFDESLAMLTGIELTVAAGCLARTFLEMTGAETLVLTADGALLDGNTAMTLPLSGLALYDDTPDKLHGKATVYYTDAQRRYLIGSSVTVNLNDASEIPGYLLEQLLQPPPGSGLSSPLPGGTQIRSVSVEDGLCTVDFSAEFENRRFYSRSAQLLTLAGVVNTLTELEHIDRVEFSVDGNLLIRYGAVTISEPLVRDTRFVGPVRTALGEIDASLYLVHSPEGGLLEIPVRIRRTTAVTREELLMRALLADTGDNGFSTRIPEGTALNQIIIRDGICHVDLSGEYLASPGDLLWSGRVIAATLCTAEGISGVQITVDGAVPEGMDAALFGVLTPENDWYL